MAKKLIVANWKMYLTLRQSIALTQQLRSKLNFVQRRRTKLSFNLVLCPSFVALEEVAKALRGTRVRLGAQAVEAVSGGAYTGEIGLDDLRELGVEYVLVGHSERRRYFGETDAVVNKKLRAVLKAGMRPILCVGEPKQELRIKNQELGRANNYVQQQLQKNLQGITRAQLKNIIIAYEPIWAIGTGRPDTPEDASLMHGWIRKMADKYPHPTLSQRERGLRRIQILYGGSVNSKNAAAFLRAPGIDGLLIGKASTSFSEFGQILKLC